MELNRQKVLIIIIGAIAVIVLGLYLFLYGPLIKELKKARLESKAIEEVLFQARGIITSSETKDIKRSLIEEEDVSLAIDGLTRGNKSEDITFISLKPEQVEKSNRGPYNILPIEIEIESSYEELGEFLGSLDDMERCLVKVRGFNLVPGKENLERLDTKLTVDIYLKAQDEE